MIQISRMPAKPPIRKVLSMVIVLGVAMLMILNIPSILNDRGTVIYQSYFADVFLPFAFYYILCMSEERISWLGSWQAKAGIILTGTIMLEVMQKFGVYALGITFDPWDILMYILGVSLAVFLDRALFARFVRGWNK